MLCVYCQSFLTGECAHDFALQFFGDRVTELGGNVGCYILCYGTTKETNEMQVVPFLNVAENQNGGCNIIPMRWSLILSSTDSMSSRVRLLDPTRPLSIPNMPPKPPPFLELKSQMIVGYASQCAEKSTDV